MPFIKRYWFHVAVLVLISAIAVLTVVAITSDTALLRQTYGPQ